MNILCEQCRWMNKKWVDERKTIKWTTKRVIQLDIGDGEVLINGKQITLTKITTFDWIKIDLLTTITTTGITFKIGYVNIENEWQLQLPTTSNWLPIFWRRTYAPELLELKLNINRFPIFPLIQPYQIFLNLILFSCRESIHVPT